MKRKEVIIMEVIIMEVVVNTSVRTVNITEEEKQAYVEFVKSKYPNKHITKLVITPVNDEEVELYSEFDSTPFQRIRRITGYLVGSDPLLAGGHTGRSDLPVHEGKENGLGDFGKFDRNTRRAGHCDTFFLVKVEVHYIHWTKIFPRCIRYATQLLGFKASSGVVVALIRTYRGQNKQVIIRLHYDLLVTAIIFPLSLHLSCGPAGYDPLTIFKYIIAHTEPLFLPI